MAREPWIIHRGSIRIVLRGPYAVYYIAPCMPLGDDRSVFNCIEMELSRRGFKYEKRYNGEEGLVINAGFIEAVILDDG